MSKFQKTRMILKDTKALLVLGLPIVCTMVGNITIGLIDTYVIGQVSSKDLAGVAAGQVLFMAAVMIGQGLLSGMEPFLAQAFGEKNHKKLSLVMAQGFWLAFILSLLVTPCLYFLSDYYQYLGATKEVTEYTKPYLRVISFSFPSVVFFSYLQRCLQAQDRSMAIFFIMLLTNILNFLADYILVHGLYGFAPMGAEGVAWASFVSRGFAFIMLFGVFAGSKNKNTFFHYLKKIDKTLLLKATKVGLPVAAQMTLEVSAFALATTLAAGISAVSLAAHHIVLSICSFTFMFPLGISMASSVKVGQYIGAKDTKRAYLNGWITIILGILIMSFFAGAFLVFGKELTEAFSKDPQVTTLAAGLFGLCALFQIFDGIQVIVGGALRGAANTSYSLCANVIGHFFIGIPLSIYLCFEKNMGIKGLWIGLASGLMIAASLLLWIWIKRGKTACEKA